MASLRHLLNEDVNDALYRIDRLGRVNSSEFPSSPTSTDAARVQLSSPSAAIQSCSEVPSLAALDDAMRARGMAPLPGVNTLIALAQPVARAATVANDVSSFAAAAPLPTSPYEENTLKRGSQGNSNPDPLKLRRVTPDSQSFNSPTNRLHVSSMASTSSQATSDFEEDLPSDWPSPIASSCTDFTLLSQPKHKQRKSYANENRYLAPNPMVIQYVGAPAFLPVTGTVTCTLVDSQGVSASSEFASALDGVTTISLHGDGRAEFQLKMLATNGGEYLRLRFDIVYESGNPRTAKQGRIITDAFRVDTNVRRRVTDRRRKAVSDELSFGGLTPPKSPKSPPVATPGMGLSQSASSALSRTGIRLARKTSAMSLQTGTSSPMSQDPEDDDAIRALAELSVKVEQQQL